ncbi:MAG TPA: LPS export ABC transporter periplasmic protein LptC [Burkholderiaceae bacterium]
MKRDRRRFGALPLLMLALALALGSFWLLRIMQKEINDTEPAVKRNDPEYFVDNFTFVRLSKSGHARYVVNGAQLTHRPQDDTTEIAQPLMQSFTAERAPTTIRAQKAQVARDASSVELSGDVRIERAKSIHGGALQLKTASLTVLPDDDIMRTSAAVDVQMGESHMTATGMEANNATGQLQLLSKVRMRMRSAP